MDLGFGLSKLLAQSGSRKSGKKAVARSNVIALVNIRGTIQDGEDKPRGLRSENGQNFEKLRPLIEQAFEMPGIVGVVLLINSPGGSPTQTNLIANFIRQKREDTKVPVYAVVEDMAASGGYWLACSADEIFVDENSMVGSIGVVTLNVGLAGTLRKYGVVPRVQVTGRNKASLHPLVDYNENQERLIKDSMTVIQQNFTNYVKKRRPGLRDREGSDVFSGRVFVGRKAVRAGLADAVATLPEVLESKFPGRDDLQLLEVKLKRNVNLLNALTGLFSQSASHLFHNLGDVVGEAGGAMPAPRLDVLHPEPRIML